MDKKKLRMRLDFDRDEIFLEDSHQKGTQTEPHLSDRAKAVVESLEVSELLPSIVEVDANTNEVILTYRVDDLEKRQDTILAAAGMQRVDLRNGKRLAELFMNGGLSREAFSKLMELEGETNAQNEDIRKFFELLDNGIVIDDDDASKS